MEYKFPALDALSQDELAQMAISILASGTEKEDKEWLEEIRTRILNFKKDRRNKEFNNLQDRE